MELEESLKDSGRTAVIPVRHFRKEQACWRRAHRSGLKVMMMYALPDGLVCSEQLGERLLSGCSRPLRCVAILRDLEPF
jgi:hypothetical protein